MAGRIIKLVALIPGDGIGKEVTLAARAVLEALSSPRLSFNFVHLDAGFECFQRTGNALPNETVEALTNGDCEGALFGAVGFFFIYFKAY